MKRKLIAGAIGITMLLFITACGGDSGKQDTVPSSTPSQSSSVAVTPTPSASAPAEASGGVQVDEGLLSIDITLPASMFEGQDMSTFDAESYTKEQGFSKTVVNDDGSITVTMSKAKHAELLKEMTAQTEQSFSEMVNSEDYPYIKQIDHDEGFKTITATVDRAAYEAEAINFTPLALGMAGSMYQIFTSEDVHVEIIIKDTDTGDIVTTSVYPDDING